jgi:hypothetical protein
MKVVIWNMILYSLIDVPEECAPSVCRIEDRGTHSSKTTASICHQAAQHKVPEDSNPRVEYCLYAGCDM